MNRTRLRLVLAAIALSVTYLPAVPAGADHEENPRKATQEVGFNGMENKGFNTDIWTQVTSDGQRLFGYTGTWGTLTAIGGDLGQECPSETDPAERDNPLIEPSQEGVWIVDATDPTDPTIAAKIPTVVGAQNLDMKVASVDTGTFSGDLLVHSLEPCGAEGILHQIPGSPLIDVLDEFLALVDVGQTGFEVYDVTEPSGPIHEGTYNNGGIGTHNLYVYDRPDLGGRAFVAAVWNHVDFLGVEEEDLIVGELQIVEITDPSNPTLVGSWRLDDAGLDCPARGNDSAFCFLHDVWVSDDGATAYLSFWDAGLILLDVTDPTSPTLIGQALGQVQSDDPEGWLNEEGNTHAAVPMTVGGQELVIVGDEDFTGGGQIGVTVNSPASLADFHPATQWDGTAPVSGQTADLVYAGTGCTAADYVTATGIHGQTFTGKVALVDKRVPQAPFTSPCPTFTFKQKMDAAEAAGAIGLVQVDEDDPPSAGNAIESGIPGLEISNSAGVPIRDAVLAGMAVNVTLERGGEIDPWGFMRVVDVTDPDPANWREVQQFKAPHVEDPNPPHEDVYTAHNPLVGPDGRVYFSWYTNGVRILEPGGSFNEVGWFVPRASDHPDDNDEDPHGAQEDNFGFWGSKAVCHPTSGDLLVLNSDLNRGMYVLEALLDDNGACGDDGEPRLETFVTGGGQAPGSSDDGPIGFGFNARDDGTETQGHINVRDHGTGQRIRAVSVDSVTEFEGEIVIRGTCSLDRGAPEECEIRAIDNGEPGTEDEFRIEVGPDGSTYSAGGRLARGDIKVH